MAKDAGASRSAGSAPRSRKHRSRSRSPSRRETGAAYKRERSPVRRATSPARVSKNGAKAHPPSTTSSSKKHTETKSSKATSSNSETKPSKAPPSTLETKGSKTPSSNADTKPSKAPASTPVKTPTTKTPTTKDLPKPDSEDENSDEAALAKETADLKAIFGFSTFKSTKNTKVPGNEYNHGVYKPKKTEYRQYMNRQGGFNRPLSPPKVNTPISTIEDGIIKRRKGESVTNRK